MEKRFSRHLHQLIGKTKPQSENATTSTSAQLPGTSGTIATSIVVDILRNQGCLFRHGLEQSTIGSRLWISQILIFMYINPFPFDPFCEAMEIAGNGRREI